MADIDNSLLEGIAAEIEETNRHLRWGVKALFAVGVGIMVMVGTVAVVIMVVATKFIELTIRVVKVLLP